MREVIIPDQADSIQPMAYAFDFIQLGGVVNALGASGPRRETVTLWRKAGLLLAVDTRYPNSSGGVRRFVSGYITGLASHLLANPRTDLTRWSEEARRYSRGSRDTVLLTKLAYDEAIDAATQDNAEEPYVDLTCVASLTGVPLQSVTEKLSTPTNLPEQGIASMVLRSTIDAHVSWQHEALNSATCG